MTRGREQQPTRKPAGRSRSTVVFRRGLSNVFRRDLWLTSLQRLLLSPRHCTRKQNYKSVVICGRERRHAGTSRSAPPDPNSCIREDEKNSSAWKPRKPLCILECVRACTCMPSPAFPCSAVSVISWGRCQTPWWMTSLTAAAVNSSMKGGTHPACASKIGGTVSGSLTVQEFLIQSLLSMGCGSKTVHTQQGGQKVCFLIVSNDTTTWNWTSCSTFKRFYSHKVVFYHFKKAKYELMWSVHEELSFLFWLEQSSYSLFLPKGQRTLINISMIKKIYPS